MGKEQRRSLKTYLPHSLAAIGSLASVGSFLVSIDNDTGRTLAIAISSTLALVGFYVRAREDTPALPELVLVFGFFTVLIHLFTQPTIFSALVQVSCMLLLVFMSSTTRRFFDRKPNLSVVLLFLPSSMFSASFLMMNHWVAHALLNQQSSSLFFSAKAIGTFEIRGSMLVANAWEELLRLGTYLSGVTNLWLSGLLWASGHSLPEAGKAGQVGVAIPAGNEDIFQIWVGLALIIAFMIEGAILLYVLKLTGSIWNVFLIHILTNLAGFSISVGSSVQGLLLTGLFLVLGAVWLLYHLKYVRTRYSKTLLAYRKPIASRPFT